MTEAIYCVKETSLTCCGKGYRIGNVKESKRLEEHICRVHILEGDGDWFNEAYSVGKCTPANTAVPYNFRTQGLLCGYCERGNNQGKYFKPQSMGNHIVQSCQRHVPLQVRDTVIGPIITSLCNTGPFYRLQFFKSIICACHHSHLFCHWNCH